MPRKKRILVASAHCGIGHTQAAAALKQVFDAEYGDSVEATLVDILDYGPSFFKKFYSGGYFWLADSHPEIWRRLYYKSKRRGRNTRFNLFIQDFFLRGFVKFVFDLEPDAVIGTHFLVREILAPHAAKGRFTAPFYFCVTDFDMHPLHVGPEVAHYFVATEATRFSVHKNGGVPLDSVTATGIPLRPQFAGETDADKVRGRLGIEKGGPTVLVMTSGFAQAGIPEMIDIIARIEPAARVVVICGNNERLKKNFDSKKVPGSFKLVPLGYTENVAEIMNICDLMLSKAGGLSSSEAFSAGLPLIITNMIPGQEEENALHHLQAGVARLALDPGHLEWHLSDLLQNKDKLAAMRDKARALGKPRAAYDIAGKVVGDISAE